MNGLPAQIANSPLLRLDDFCLRLIVGFIDTRDALALIRSGQPLVSARVAQNLPRFEGIFKPSGFVDCNAHLRTLAPFQRLTSLSLTTKYGLQRVYAPINWDILPPKLTDLTLKFAGCFDSFLSTHLLSTRFEGLKHLSLLDTSPKHVEAPHIALDFYALPRHLLTLSIETARYTPFLQPSMEGLPPQLEILSLRVEQPVLVSFDLTSAYHSSIPPTSILPLARLPESLRKFELTVAHWLIWNIEMSRFPSSLESFKLNGVASHPLHPRQYQCSMLDTDGIGHLTCLREFLCKSVTIPLSALIGLPTSVTSLDAVFASSDVSLLQASPGVLHKLVSYDWSYTPFPPTMALEQCQQLTIAKLQNHSSPKVPFPSTLTDLQTSQLYGPLPPLLKRLTWNSAEHADIALTSLLPRSLEALILHKGINFWHRICELCDTGELPNLVEMRFSPTDVLTSVPKQLTRLTLNFDFPVKLSTAFYEALRLSEIRYLYFRAYGDTPNVREMAHVLLSGGLPEKLESLSIQLQTALPASAHWPRTLTHLHYSSNAIEATIERDGCALFRSLPQGMISLSLETISCGATGSSIPLHNLPPYLSHFELWDPQDHEAMVISIFPALYPSTILFKFKNPNFPPTASFCSPLIGRADDSDVDEERRRMWSDHDA